MAGVGIYLGESRHKTQSSVDLIMNYSSLYGYLIRLLGRLNAGESDGHGMRPEEIINAYKMMVGKRFKGKMPLGKNVCKRKDIKILYYKNRVGGLWTELTGSKYGELL